MPPAEISWSSFYRNLEESGERLNPETPVETAGGRRVDLSRFFEHSAPAWASKPGRNRNLWRGAILRELQSAPVSVINTWREHFCDWRPVELLETRQERRSHLKPERLARPIRSGHLRVHS